MKNRLFIIAEAGVNHNGSILIAKRLIDAAAASGADAVKFQTFKAANMVSRNAPKAEYQNKHIGSKESHFNMLKKLELGINAHKKLKEYCEKKKIIFISSPFDMESVDLLDSLKLKIIKIPSGEITNMPYLKKIGKLRKKVIMSTGMSTLKEIENALSILMKSGTPKKNITILHCSSAYPAPIQEANLTAMLAIKKAFNVKVGYSDHSVGIEIPIAAATLGAAVLEKHFTLDRDMQGPDHKVSLEPHEFKAMTQAIRNVEKALGNGIKRPHPAEFKNRQIIRKSIVAARDIKRGEILTDRNITAKRPAIGISPMKWDEVIGKPLSRDFKKDSAIEL